MTQRKSLDLLLVREQDLGGVRSGQLQAVMFFFLFLEERLVGLQPEGAALHPAKGL